MKEIYRYRNVILLSDKTLGRAEESRVWFTDGSAADLDRRAFINRGMGKIKVNPGSDGKIAKDVRTETLLFQGGNTIALQGGDLYFDLYQSHGAVTSLEIIGTERFHSAIDVYETVQGVVVETPDRRVKGEYPEGRIILKAPGGAAVYIKNRGNGTGRIFSPIELLKIEIKGSLRLKCSIVSNADIKIDGCGYVHIENATKSCTVELNGSGNVRVGSGELTELKANVNGSGSINAAVIAHRAELVLRGSGSISVAHVIGQSHEVRGGSGSVTVLKRGYQHI